MKLITFFKREIFILAVLIAPIVMLIANWNILPDKLPFHWNINGDVDNYAPKYVPIIMNIALYLILLIAPKIRFRKQNEVGFSSSYFKLRFIFTLYFGVLTVFIISNGLSFKIDASRFFSTSIFILFTLIGNYIATLRQNWFVGIRTPWTIRSEVNWRETHQFGSKIWFWGGIVGTLISLILPTKFLFIIMIVFISIIGIVPVVFSYTNYKKLKQQEWHMTMEYLEEVEMK